MALIQWQNRYCRVAECKQFGLKLTQQSNDEIPARIEAPRIGWSSSLPVSIDTAEAFAQELLEAARLAREWEQDTGKPYTVLGKPEALDALKR